MKKQALALIMMMTAASTVHAGEVPGTWAEILSKAGGQTVYWNVYKWIHRLGHQTG